MDCESCRNSQQAPILTQGFKPTLCQGGALCSRALRLGLTSAFPQHGLFHRAEKNLLPVTKMMVNVWHSHCYSRVTYSINLPKLNGLLQFLPCNLDIPAEAAWDSTDTHKSHMAGLFSAMLSLQKRALLAQMALNDMQNTQAYQC